ncbi:MAG TPA: methionine ABC transporter ATP-binding protein [Pseudonocardiaceae bacterium]|nr:methionine ABC transporter ATP-binding protein [Pseudonocardiaceae bacterium]
MITVENLTKSYLGRTGTVTALDDITLDVPEGTLCGVVGPVGAGKSTLARLVGLQERPDRGAIRVGGTNLMALAASQLRGVRRQIGVLPATSTLLAQRTVAGNIAMPLEQAGVDGPQRRARVAELLDLAGLTDRAGDLPGTLSTGQRQRVGVARTLATGPAVLVADEPTDGLDAQDAAGVLTVLDRVRAELGTTVVLATKDSGVVRRLCDDVAVLDGGRLVERGSILDLIADPDSWTASAILPAVPEAPRLAGHDQVANLVLIGFATVGALLPEAASRFGVQINVLGGGITRLGDTPVARFQVGVTGERACGSLSWVAEQGAVVHRVPCGPQGVVAA